MINFFKSYYPDSKLFAALVTISAMYVVGFFSDYIYYFSNFALVLLAAITIFEIVILYSGNKFNAIRKLPDRLSNGDDNLVSIDLINNYNFQIYCEIIDELPVQFQKRDFRLFSEIKKLSSTKNSYIVRPTERGAYKFGNLIVFVSTKIGFGKRKYTFLNNYDTAVYPSFINLKYFELMSISNKLNSIGIREIRKFGQSMEFEQIRDYRSGDDYRTVNWKATARKGELMVNQYIDERSQSIYSVIDKGRNMKMPFDGLTLLDYAINSSLALSSVIQKKYDKPGLITFSTKVDQYLQANNQTSQLPQIFEYLYKSETDFKESSFENLYSFIRRKIPQRSLLMIYTNFESIDSMRRNIEYFKLISKFHLPLIILFENTEISKLLLEDSEKDFDVYRKIYAEQYLIEKNEIVSELRANGINAMLSKPENLTINAINKYIEIKSKRLV